MTFNARPMRRREWLQSMVAAPALIGLTARGQNAATWKAGVAKADITPTETIWLAGYGARTRPSEGVLQKIYLKCVALQSADGTPTAWVTSLSLLNTKLAPREGDFITLVARPVKMFNLYR